MAKTFKVQLEDGTVETFTIDDRVSDAMIPSILEGAVRARMRVKSGQKPLAPATAPQSVFSGSSVTDRARQLATGLAQIPADIGRNFIEGAGIINKSPSTALSVLPEIVAAPLRNAQANYPFASHLGLPVGGNPTYSGMAPVEARAAAVESIPIVGPIATDAGVKMAAGEGYEAIGNITGNTLLAGLGAKYGNNALRRIGQKSPSVGGKGLQVLEETATEGTKLPTKAPVSAQTRISGKAQFSNIIADDPNLPPMAKTQAGHTTSQTHIPNKSGIQMAEERLQAEIRPSPAQTNVLGGAEAKVTPEMVKSLREALESSPEPKVTKPIHFRLPVRVRGLGGTTTWIPIEIQLSGHRMAAARAFLSSARGSAAESLWAQRILEGLTKNEENKEED